MLFNEYKLLELPFYFPLLRSLFCHIALSYYLVSCHFILQDTFEHFLQGRSNGNESLIFCLSGNILMSPSLSKDGFVRCKILDPTVVFFYHLEFIVTLPCGLQFFGVKSADSLIEDPLPGSCAFQIFLLVFVFLKFDYNTSRYGPLKAHLT